MATRNVKRFTTTTSGSIPKGARAISIDNTGAGAGTVAGATLAAGASFSVAVGQMDDLEELSYDATGTTFLISVQR